MMNNICFLNTSTILKLESQLKLVPHHSLTDQVVGTEYNEPFYSLYSKIISAVLHVNSANSMENTLYSIYTTLFKTDQIILNTFHSLYPYNHLGTNFKTNINLAKNIIKDSSSNSKSDSTAIELTLKALIGLSNLGNQIRNEIYMNILHIVRTIDAHIFIAPPFIDSIILYIDNNGMSLVDDQLVDIISKVNKYGSITIKDNHSRLMLIFKNEDNQINACELDSVIPKITAA